MRERAAASTIGGERVLAKHVARFKIPLPRWSDAANRITIVYSESHDGLRQKRLIASSQLRFGNAGTLGETYAVDPAEARCVVKNGVLQPRRLPLRPTAAAISAGRL